MEKFGPLAEAIVKQKYLWGNETWSQLAERVAGNILWAIGIDNKNPIMHELKRLIEERKFLPAGRYLYSAGRPFHMTMNCLCLGVEDNREGWSDLLQKASMALMTGAGIGVDYSKLRCRGSIVKKTGGIASGPVSLMKILNEAARHIQQGGSRRSAVLASLLWRHPDIDEFITAKNWDENITRMKSISFEYPAPLDMCNISVRLDDDFLTKYAAGDEHAVSVYKQVIKQMCSTGEPGLSINLGKDSEWFYTNACQPETATVLTPTGISTFKDIDVGSIIWSGSKWTPIVKKWCTGEKEVHKYTTSSGIFLGTPNHVVISKKNRIKVEEAITIDACRGPMPSIDIIDPVDIMDGLVLGDGSVHEGSNNLIYLLIGAKDRDYYKSEIRKLLVRDRSKAFGDISKNIDAWEVVTTITSEELPKTYNREVPARFYYGGYLKKIGFLRGLFTANGCVTAGRVNLHITSKILIYQVSDMLSSLGIKSSIAKRDTVKVESSNGEYECKPSYNLNIYADSKLFMDLIGFIQEYKTNKSLTSREGNKPRSAKILSDEILGVFKVYEITVEAEEHTYWTGGLLVSNCSEFRSDEPDNVCNLGSINLARIDSLEEFTKVVELASLFLYAGTFYSDVPYQGVQIVRDRKRQIGLGLMGVHEWLIKRGFKYGDTPDELKQWLEVYAQNLETIKPWADRLGTAMPEKGRAVAPTGTIGILAETTTGCEPVFCLAYKRRYLKGDTWLHQYVVDPTAKRLIDEGVPEQDIEDAYSISAEKRISFQAFLQDYVDMAISSTINMPKWGSEFNNSTTVDAFGKILMKYLPRLRGITVYPDASRSGQPLVPVRYSTALKRAGTEFVEGAVDVCDLRTGGGSCGS